MGNRSYFSGRMSVSPGSKRSSCWVCERRITSSFCSNASHFSVISTSGIGCFGGGTGLPTQRECLELMDCAGAGNADIYLTTINANGTIGNVVAEEPDDLKNSVVRFVDSGVILNYESARNIHLWLGERLKEMESIEQAKAAFNLGTTEPGTSH